MAGTVLRNGPANGWRMEPTMKRLKILQWAAIHLSFSRTARRSVPAFECFPDRLLANTHHISPRAGGADGEVQTAVIDFELDRAEIVRVARR